MKNKLSKNIIYQILYQIIVLFVPLILNPYLVKKLGVESIGTYTVIFTIVNYFVLFENLGIEHYGNRCIAINKDNSNNLNKCFTELTILKFVLSSFVIVVYYLTVIIFFDSNIYYFIMGGFVVASLFDFSWLCYGLEKFRLNTIRNLFAKIIMMVMIFIFVKTKDDLLKYMIIMVLIQIISNICVYFGCKKNVKFVKINFKNCENHIKGMIMLFLPIVSLTLYRNIDKTMLGIIVSNEETGYYECAEKIIVLVCGLLTCINTVMLPRISNLISQNKKEKANEYIYKTYIIVFTLSSACSFGIFAVSNNFVNIYYGDDFEYISKIIKYLSITIFMLSINNLLRTQILIPNNKDKEYSLSLIVGLVVNIIANSILIPKYYAIGAAVGTIIAEAIVFILEMLFSIKQLNNLIHVTLYCFPTIFFGLIMLIVINIIDRLIKCNLILVFFLEILVGAIIYLIMCFIYFNIIKRLRWRKNESKKI